MTILFYHAEEMVQDFDSKVCPIPAKGDFVRIENAKANGFFIVEMVVHCYRRIQVEKMKPIYDDRIEVHLKLHEPK